MTGFVNLFPSGCILTATKNSAYTERDAFVDITYKNLGYVPQLFVSPVVNSIFSSTTNDIF